MILFSPNFTMNCINAGTTCWFRFEIGCALSQAPRLTRAGNRLIEYNRALWRIFSLASRILNKISIASALRLPTFKSVDNKID